ncbi:MAG: pitrilysin family protein, partial [Pyrinomonadaceae bacterium]
MRFWILDFGFWIAAVSFCLSVPAVELRAQDVIPAPGPAKSVNVPAVKETKLKNGLTVAVVEKHSAPIVTVQLLVRAGAGTEGIAKAGLANLTADMLTKGTKTRTAEQIAEEMEFLGASINTGAGWNSSSVSMTVTSDKLDQAMAIMSDVALNPTFKREELDLLKSQSLDELQSSLTQPAFLANYVGSVYALKEHPAGGTAASVGSMTRDDVAGFYSRSYSPNRSVLIFTGDITSARAATLAEKLFGDWPSKQEVSLPRPGVSVSNTGPREIAKRILVVDLPKSGQASVSYFRPIDAVGRGAKTYYTAAVLNSLLGGGYSSRLNQEIRIKRGLSYGAGSAFGWRAASTNFTTRTQTKNESAAEVAELVIGELRRLGDTDAAETELNPRRLVLTGNFGRNLESTAGLASAIGDLYSFGVPTTELNNYMSSVTGVTCLSLSFEISPR